MKRINACASDAQLSFDLSNSLLTPSFHNSHLRNKFKLTPIAVACVCALCSLSANAATPSFPNNDLQDVTGKITLDSDTIKETLNGLQDNDKRKQDLVGFFNDDKYWQEGSEGSPDRYITTNNTRINIELNKALLQPQDDKFLIQNPSWSGVKPSDEEAWNKEYHGYFTIKASNNNLTIQYDFKKDGRDDNGNPRSTHTTALSFFENAMMSVENNTDLKYFVFTPTVNLITKNQLIDTDNQNKGDGRSSLGLSLSNKKRNITFKEEVNFISDFSFFGQGSDDREQSGVNGLSIASGIYNVFGAANYDPISKINSNGTDYISEYGKINFEKFATVSVTHSVRDDYSEKDMANPEYNEVFGVFNNEGATTNFLNGANIVVKGHNKDGIVAALASASTLGVLDPYKQGTISVKASEDNTVSRIWALSVAYDSKNADASPFSDTSDTEEYIQDQDILSSQDVKNEWNKYITNTENMEGGKLRFAALSMHGSNIEISDENRSGYFDIRGDVMAGMLNGEGTKSNTFMNNTSYAGSQLSGTVQHASITINLTNAQSKLYGNIYERHSFGEEESAHLKYNNTTAQSNSEWKAEQTILEQDPEAGKVNLTLNNGATWMPQQKWFGWNYDFVHPDFYKAYNKFQETGTLTESEYGNFDLSDQYNLKVWNEETKKYDDKNKTDKNTDAVNDSDLITDKNSYFDKIDKTDFTTVDNGIYHLALNDGGVVDTRYMRQDFNFSTVNDVIGNNMDYSQLDQQGIKKLRIQELAGNGGTFNIFVKNFVPG